MDLSFTAEEQSFRDEVRRFFAKQVPDNARRAVQAGRHVPKQEQIVWQRKLNAKGWAVPHWPVEYGGTNWSPTKRYIFTQEMQLAAAPPAWSIGTNLLAPVIYTFGNEKQKRYFLPRIANLDDWWCQGFSEPEAGSDLASLRTSAKREGDHYVVNGQKIWTTLAHYADGIFCLVRTSNEGKKQTGISFLLIDLKTPGVTVRPIITIEGWHDVNEVFFDNVRVPVENLIGDENKGWDYAKFLLGNERTGIARVGVSRERIRRIKELARHTVADGRPIIEDQRFLDKITAIEIELKALELTQLRVVAAEEKHGKGKPNPASSVLKIKGTEIQQATTELMLEVLGPMAAKYVAPGEERDDMEAWLQHVAPSYFNNRKLSIYGGSNEIQRNVIAKAVLSL